MAGSVAWFAGVWWLIVSLIASRLADAALWVGKKLAFIAKRTSELAIDCAVEAGGER